MCVARGECDRPRRASGPGRRRRRGAARRRPAGSARCRGRSRRAPRRPAPAGSSTHPRDEHLAVVAGRLDCPRVRRVEAVGDEVEGRAAFHLDRFALVVGEDEDGRVVRRLVAPPATPVARPTWSTRPEPAAEHVAAHHVGTRAPRQVLTRRRRRSRGAASSDGKCHSWRYSPPIPSGVLDALVGPGQEAVERDGHVAGGAGHAVQTASVTRTHRSGQAAMLGGQVRTSSSRLGSRDVGDQGTNALAALILGSVVAVLLFIPVAAVQYRRDGRLGPARPDGAGRRGRLRRLAVDLHAAAPAG